MKFILSRTNDYELHSKKWIIGYGLLFWLVTRILAISLVACSTWIYSLFGIDPEQLTRFSGDPTTVKAIFSTGYAVLMLLLIAPLLEECIFRLGLSFKKWQIAVSITAIPAYIMFQGIGRMSPLTEAILATIALSAFCAVYFLTSQSVWDAIRHRYFKPMIWITSIAFGLMHLIAFSTFDIVLIPYMLCFISIQFFGGCAIAYYRVNLGFLWGVALHIFNNIPAIIMIANM